MWSPYVFEEMQEEGERTVCHSIIENIYIKHDILPDTVINYHSPYQSYTVKRIVQITPKHHQQRHLMPQPLPRQYQPWPNLDNDHVVQKGIRAFSIEAIK